MSRVRIAPGALVCKARVGSDGSSGPTRAALVEIGRVPRRDRSSSASRSVHFRTEIGSVARNRFRQGGAERLCPSGPRSNAVPRRRRGFHGR
ncbi:MAG: hypothetical protein DI576_04935 [Actinomyces sp.]|nr:MAG: hypothetical protein DI576_04935 [Actinomyces sp.]